MELDVRLTREGEEPWGFEFIGGADHEIPLTISKVYPSSPAASAGLQAGDLVARLGDRLAAELSLAAAEAVVTEAVGSLALGVCRGLYDPVLDDFEPVYETDRPDSDLRSEPTEVTCPIEPNEITLDTLNDFLDTGICTNLQDRSLTASPFVPNTKPYRPFSTEPLEVPPVEDPIILNPNYKDQFGGIDKAVEPEDDLLKLFPLEKNVESKFKLPVSDKYDPNWDKRVDEMLARIERGEFVQTTDSQVNTVDVKTISEETKEHRVSEEFKKKEIKYESEVMTKEEIEFDKRMSKEIDMEKIELTAVDVVEESIERAVSVTREIQKEVDEEMRASMEKTTDESKISVASKESNKLQTKTENIEKYDIIESVNKELELKEQSKSKYETEFSESQEVTDLNEILDKTSVNDVKKESEVFEQEEIASSSKEDITRASKFEAMKSAKVNEYSETYNTSIQSEGKQKAFMIGLQTIPHIKGFVQSSYQFDLLLRTFFVHLTDVMVALSRFILTQPANEIEGKAQQVISEKLIKDLHSRESTSSDRTETAQRELKERKRSQEMRESKSMEERIDHKQRSTEAKHEKKVSQAEIAKIENKEEQRTISVETANKEDERKRKSGAEMALMSQRKSRDLAHKMEAVITEFETKTVRDTLEVNGVSERRRSRSRSQIEEEVVRESDPLEWLDKVDSRRTSQERTVTDVSTVKKEFSSFAESTEKKKTESTRESRTKIAKLKPGKQTYIALVESHVYTNKEAILEDLATEISETASVQSSEDIQMATESMEAVSTENLAFNHIVSEEKQQAVEVIAEALEKVVQEKHETFGIVSDFSSSQVIEEHSKSVNKESLVNAALESTEMKSVKAISAAEENYKAIALKTTDLCLESSQEFSESKITSRKATSKQEILASVAAETTEVISDSKVESFESKELHASKAVVKSEENYKTAAVEFAEVALEATDEVDLESKVRKHEAVSKQEFLATVAAESTEIIVDDSNVETFETKETQTKTAVISSEDSFKTAAIGVTEVTLEAAKEEFSKLEMKTEYVAIQEETQDLAVAEVTKTKTEICKKPAEDEHASLKIVKFQNVEAESTEISSVSEESVKNSLEISSSFQSHESYKSVQESSIQTAKLLIRTDLAQQKVLDASDENNNTPSPSTVPPTPLTDEYVFKLVIPLPKSRGTTPMPVEETTKDNPDDEDPHIVKKKLVPHIETMIEDQVIYEPPLPTPPEDKVTSPVYTKPGLRGGAEPLFRKEYIREIERKSSLLASAIDATIKSIEEYKEEVGIEKKTDIKRTEQKLTNGFTNGHAELENDLTNAKIDIAKSEKEKIRVNGEEIDRNDKEEIQNAVPGFKPVVFNPEAYQANLYQEVTRGTSDLESKEARKYVNESGEPLGTNQGIIDGLEDAVVDQKVAEELGRPGITEEKIAELISGEAEMLREAHVMGLSRVLSSHMNRPDDSSVDFQKIKPMVDSLKDSEVIKALNEEIKQKKAEEEKKKWTTFLQKPKRPVPKAKFGYHGYVEDEVVVMEPYKVKIVKQPKPKVAPDYKPENFDTGPLPWEERALTEPGAPPVNPEDPILVPEDSPEFYEAVDPLPESEVPDLVDTGIPLPPLAASPIPPEEESAPEQPPEPPEPVEEPVDDQSPKEAPPETQDMDQNRMSEQLVNSVKSMVDPRAPLDRQLAQMRAQLAALAQLPAVIQHSLELLTQQLTTMSLQEFHQSHQLSIEQQTQENTTQSVQQYQGTYQNGQEVNQNNQEVDQNNQEVNQNNQEVDQNNQEVNQNNQEVDQNNQEVNQNGQDVENNNVYSRVTIEEIQSPEVKLTADGHAFKKEDVLEEQRRAEKMKKEHQQIDQESRQVKQRAPRVGKPKRMFGPPAPEERPLVLPGGRRWRGPKDAYNEQMIAETLQAQSEIIQGKVLGINFMKYEKPPVNLDHLQQSEVYKLVHDIEQTPCKRVEMLTPVVAEADYRERCRSSTPRINANAQP